MKLASLKHGRDGRLVVVSRDLSRCVPVPAIAPTLQAALDEWDRLEPPLREAAAALEAGPVAGEIPFEPARCAAPLPRAYQWADGSAFLSHVELVRRARGAPMPPSYYHEPLMYQGGSDGFLGPCDDIPLQDEDWGCDLEGEVAVVTGDVPPGADPARAAAAIRLLILVNDVSLRNLIPDELAKGFGFFQSKPASSASPVAVTPDELGAAWRDGRVHLPLQVSINGRPFGHPDAGAMHFDFPQLIAHAARTRALAAGTLVGSGTVSNADPNVGAACIAEQRMREQEKLGRPQTPWLRAGDRIRIEMLDALGHSVFGGIDQRVAGAG